MSIKKRKKTSSSTSTRRARNRISRIAPKPSAHANGSLVSLEVLPSRSSHSPLTERFDSDPFRLEWDNDVAFHVAKNVLLLRKYREESQTRVADAAHTSQPKVARIEAGADNITLKT